MNYAGNPDGEEPFDEQKWLAGVVIILFLAFGLKLMACSIQQKIIGECLSKSETVLEMCAVHTPFMQVIKKLLEPEKCMTLAKCSILAGGPDWPTSVLAGILKIALLPCLLGTLPCFLLSSSAALSGAMLSRKGEIYAMLATAFTTLAVFFNVLYTGGMTY